ncbi:hypothetical protein BDN67DRAFT_630165 [Paxillus ammoniavirescens]|nr:hypothetical protein BDN67DRAFT_630165 [Paxillus ammoniavirescens]
MILHRSRFSGTWARPFNIQFDGDNASAVGTATVFDSRTHVANFPVGGLMVMAFQSISAHGTSPSSGFSSLRVSQTVFSFNFPAPWPRSPNIGHRETDRPIVVSLTPAPNSSTVQLHTWLRFAKPLVACTDGPPPLPAKATTPSLAMISPSVTFTFGGTSFVLSAATLSIGPTCSDLSDCVGSEVDGALWLSAAFS